MIEPAVERYRGHAIFALAAEVEVVHELVTKFLTSGDTTGRKIVDFGAVLGRFEHGPLLLGDRLGLRRQNAAAMLAEQCGHLLAIDASAVERAKNLLAVALLPAFDQRVVEHRCPAHAAFEKGKFECREALGHATEQEGAAK